jgi:hypothetical protein
MAKITANEIVVTEIPKGFHASLVLRCLGAEFKESAVKPDGSGGNPMIVSDWEVVGKPNKQNGVDDNITEAGKKYIIAGLNVRKVYHTLTPKAIRRHQEFWAKATGKTEAEYEVDNENPDTSYYKGLVMSAVCKATEFEKTRPSTDSEKEEMKAAGQPVREVVTVTDDEGKALTIKGLEVDTWNRRFNGDLPQF